MRDRHEGLFGWLARSIGGMPRGLAGAAAGFVHEVGSIFAAMGRPFVRLASPLRRTTAAPSRAKGVPARARRADRPSMRPAARARMDARQRDLLRRRLRVGLGVLLVAALVAAWFTVPGASVFKIRHVEVTGASSVGDLEVRTRIDSLLEGETIFTLDTDAVERRLEAMPFVRDASVDRHLPSGIQIVIEEYRPLALGYGDGKFWLVAHDGRILAEAEREEWIGRVPVVTLVGSKLEPGMRVDDEPALQLLTSQDPDSTLAIEQVEVRDQALFATLADGTKVRFGRPVELRQKLLAAERLIVDIAGHAGEPLLYVDVTVPARPTYCAKDVTACNLPRGTKAKSARRIDDDSAAALDDPDAAATSDQTDPDPATTTGNATPQ